MISIWEARKIAKDRTKYEHSVIVSTIMKRLAEYWDQDSVLWEIVGILHDIDWDETRVKKELHGVIAAEQLRDKLSDAALDAIRCHDHRTGFKPTTKLDKALIFADGLAHIFINMNDISGFSYNLFLDKLDHETSKGRPWMKNIILTYIDDNDLNSEFLNMLWKKTST